MFIIDIFDGTTRSFAIHLSGHLFDGHGGYSMMKNWDLETRSA